jgi:hypothetical protein
LVLKLAGGASIAVCQAMESLDRARPRTIILCRMKPRRETSDIDCIDVIGSKPIDFAGLGNLVLRQ